MMRRQSGTRITAGIPQGRMREVKSAREEKLFRTRVRARRNPPPSVTAVFRNAHSTLIRKLKANPLSDASAA